MSTGAVIYAGIAQEVASVISAEVEGTTGKPLSWRDLQAALALLQGDMTRRQLQEATGLSELQAHRATQRLRKVGVAQVIPPHITSDTPIYGLLNRENLLKSIEKLCATRGWGITCDGGSPTSYSFPYKREKEETGGATKAPALSLRDAPPQAGLPFLFTTDAARSLMNGLACPSKRDAPTWNAWRRDPSLLQKEESRLFVNMFPFYRKDFADPIARTDHFAQVYWTIRTARLGSSSMPIKENNPIWWANLLLARQRADDTALPYEVFIEGVRLRREHLHTQEPSKFRSSFPELHQLKTEKAAQAARDYRASLKDNFTTVMAAAQKKPPYTEDEFDPEEPDQRLCYQWVWEDALVAKHSQDGHGDVLAGLIHDGRLPLAILGTSVLGLPESVLQDAWEAMRPDCYGNEFDERAEKCCLCPFTALSGTEAVPEADDCETAFLKAKRKADKATRGQANCMDSGPRQSMTPNELDSALDKAFGL